MKKIILICSILVSFMFSSEVKWIGDYKNAVEESKKSDKPILMLIDRPNCPYCRLLKRDVIGSDKVSSFLNKKFILLKVNQNDDTYPKEMFLVHGTPTTFFLNSSGKIYFGPIIGYVEKEKYLRYLKMALDKWK